MSAALRRGLAMRLAVMCLALPSSACLFFADSSKTCGPDLPCKVGHCDASLGICVADTASASTGASTGATTASGASSGGTTTASSTGATTASDTGSASTTSTGSNSSSSTTTTTATGSSTGSGPGSSASSSSGGSSGSSGSTGLPDAGPPAQTRPVGPQADPCLADATPAGTIFYVDPTNGDDGNPGSKALPKKTLGAAITATVGAPTGSEIHICAGQLDESVVLNQPVSIKGGYDCAFNGRPQLCFDPALADGGTPYFAAGAPANQTTLTCSSTSSAYTLKIDASSTPIGNDVVIDGLTITGPPASGAAEFHTVEVAGGASPTLSNCVIEGGGGGSSVSGVGSAGVMVTAGSPEIHHDVIRGGKGQVQGNAQYLGSVAIDVQSSTGPHIHDNRIEGGAGKALVQSGVAGSAGVFLDNPLALTQTAGLALERNSIFGGTGTANSSVDAASVGLYLLWSCTQGVDVLGNVIHGGTPASGGSGSFAIFDNGGGNGATITTNIVGNKIYGGDSSGSTTGIKLLGAHAQTNVVNNFIHAGNPQSSATSIGLRFGSVQFQPTIVAHNMIYAGGSGSSPGYALWLENDSHSGHTITVNNNILVGSGSQSGGVYLDQCPQPTLISGFKGNLFINESYDGIYGPDVAASCPNTPSTFTTLASLEAQMPTFSASGNFAYLNDCSADASHCVVRAACATGTPDACMRDLLLSWDSTSRGLADLLSDTSWNLNPAPSTAPYLPACSLIQSAIDDYGPSPFDVDIFGNPRRSGPTVGAVQLLVPCAP
ncbi:MAG: hypothetical protein JST54_15360 [Deltaproteobacteria bacterium]|nr:hypothetical protein [Deltaproteobacteria bacterium]